MFIFFDSKNFVGGKAYMFYVLLQYIVTGPIPTRQVRLKKRRKKLDPFSTEWEAHKKVNRSWDVNFYKFRSLDMICLKHHLQAGVHNHIDVTEKAE